MLETSKDLLNIVIAFCVLWFTAFVCWFIYYVINIIKRVAETMDQVAKMANGVNQFFDEAKTRMQKASSYLPLIIDGAKKLFEFAKEKKDGTKRKTKKTE